MRSSNRLLLLLAPLLAALCATAQHDAPPDDGLYARLGQRAATTAQHLDRTTAHCLARLLRHEQRLRARLARTDSVLAARLFQGLEQRYAALADAPPAAGGRYASAYVPHLDSLTTALRFLQGAGPAAPGLPGALDQCRALQARLDRGEAVKAFIQERRRLLEEQLHQLAGLGRGLKAFEQQAAGYGAQLRQLQAAWSDPRPLEQKLLAGLAAAAPFRAFFAQHSQLAALLGAGSGGGSSTAAGAAAGLQTRASVQQALVSRLGTGAPALEQLRGNVRAAQGQLGALKEKLAAAGSGGAGGAGGAEEAAAATPDEQTTHRFWGRLQWSASAQSRRAQALFPATSELGGTVGYRLNERSVAGVGLSYQVGWGRGWEHLRVSSEGVGLRSFVDYRLKGRLWLSAGWERHCRTAFRRLADLKGLEGWQSSGLVGVGKRYALKGRVKGEMKLLWDFLSYQQHPQTQALLFRVAYQLK